MEPDENVQVASLPLSQDGAGTTPVLSKDGAGVQSQKLEDTPLRLNTIEDTPIVYEEGASVEAADPMRTDSTTPPIQEATSFFDFSGISSVIAEWTGRNQPVVEEPLEKKSILGDFEPMLPGLMQKKEPEADTKDIPDSGIISLGYKAETPSEDDGIRGAVNAARNPDNGKKATSMEIASKYLGYDDRNSAEAKTLSSFIKKAAGININPATTAWCAAFANAVLEADGVKGTGKLNARSFLDWGQEVGTPSKGDVVVLWRESPKSWKGHVGFFDGFEEKNGKKYVRLLGGNQSGSAKVSYSNYPADKVLGYRRAKDISSDV